MNIIVNFIQAIAIFCIAVSVAAASWHGGVALVAPSAHGGAIAGHHGPAAVISGPSGVVSTAGHGHGVAVGYGLAGHGLWNGLGVGYGYAGHGVYAGHGAYAGSGHEGQWIPDINEKFYDDGSYRPEHHYGGDHIVHHAW